MTPKFVHLHLHSEYSLADSTIRISELVQRCVELKLPAVAVTDQSNLFALVKFFRAAEAAGIKPICGADVWVAGAEGERLRLTLLCQDRDGYLALSRLISRAYLEGHAGDFVAIRREWLLAEHLGLIVIAGRDSAFGQRLTEDRGAEAQRELRCLADRFEGRLYIEIVRCGRPGDEAFNARAVPLARANGLPLLASNDPRFLDRADFDAHEARVCIATGRVLDDPRRPRTYSPEQYLKSPGEMAELFADLPDALENSVELAMRCNLELQLGASFLPEFPVPEGHTLPSWLRSVARSGLDARLARGPLADGGTAAAYLQRLQSELDVIESMGFPGYFLIVADFINWAKQQGIPVGPGRGSGAGSLVAWAMGITDLDPLPYDLLFERFLNPERVSLPDFDIDFCMERRDEVIEYVAHKYGKDRVSQIITYGTMAAKAVVRDCGRVLGLPYGFVDGIAKLIPLALGTRLDDALGRSERARRNSDLSSAELIERYAREDDVRDLIDLALKLEDLTRNAGKHAGGVVIAPSPLTDFSPLFAEQPARDGTAKGAVTQFDKDDVEAVGLVKFDFLGLRTLTILDWAVKAVNARRAAVGESDLELSALPLDDPRTYALFARGATVAVFQFESRGMRELLKRARPDRFEDIIALAALFRPGPLGSGMDRDWVDRKHGEAEVSFPHPLLEPVLAPTYGVIVYQEQVMKIAQVLAGYSLGAADLLRRAMGKKKPEEMAAHRKQFEEGAVARGVERRRASAIFDLMEKFAEYGFNKSHSAAYALVAYQTAWMKTHHPAEFLAATLSADMDSTDKVVNFLAEARAIGLDVRPPDVNSSDYMFVATNDATISYGLGAVKGVGRGVCEAIVEARHRQGGFRDLGEFCRCIDPARLNRRALEALLHAGALDGLGPNRATLAQQLPRALRAAEQHAREREAGQVTLFAADPDHGASPWLVEAVPEWPLSRLLAGERESLGHYLSGHPTDPVREELQTLLGHHLGELDRVWASRRDRRGEAQLVLGGIVVGLRKRGDQQAIVQIEDAHGRIECVLFGETYAEHGHLLGRDRIVLLEGSLREDEFAGGWSLRVRRCWDFGQACAEYALRLDFRLDCRDADAWTRLDRLLAAFRPGKTPVRMTVDTGAAAGEIELDGPQAVRCDPGLLGQLRADPGVEAVRALLARPWD